MKIKIILCRPQLSKNIGSIARVMLNFGFKNLCLVGPKTDWLDDKALALAAGAEEILQKAQVFEKVSDAAADVSVVYAFTARSRYLNKENIELKNLPKEIDDTTNIALLFGPENSGLSNEDLVLASKLVQIPTNPEFSSLNLAQSVAITLYELSKHEFKQSSNAKTSKIATTKEISLFLEQLEDLLINSSFLRVEEKKKDMLINIKNIFLRISNLSSQEVRTLRGMLSALASK